MEEEHSYKNQRKPVLVAAVGQSTGILGTQKAEKLYFYHTDHLGTPILMTDENQNIVWEAEYLPFGEVYQMNGTVENNVRFLGQYYDSETCLHYNWHMYYKPEVGRYMTVDPILSYSIMERFIKQMNCIAYYYIPSTDF